MTWDVENYDFTQKILPVTHIPKMVLKPFMWIFRTICKMGKGVYIIFANIGL